ncbi:MAG: IS66 family transposase [Thiohalomonadaceae bacterium]
MAVVTDNLPNDVEALKALFIQQQALVAEQQTQLRRQDAQITSLREQLNILLAKRFGPSSEKSHSDQLGLFNEAESAIDAKDTPEATEETVTVPSHDRKKPGRKPLPDYIERVEVLHDLPEAEKVCPHDGTALERIGEEVSEQLDVIPAKVQVLRHIRPKYACPCCREGIKTAKLPPQPIPKSIASPGLLAHVCTAKYADALPLYRQESILQRAGVELPRATLAGWMLKLGDLVLPLINLLRDHLLGDDYLQMDETTVQVLKQPEKAPTAKSYMWVQRGGPPDRPIILFDYDPSRSQAVPLRLLEGFAGYLQCDGYDGYAAVGRREDIVLVGCWAHARRKFDEAVKAQGKNGKAKAGRATKGLALVQKLYRVETLAKECSPQERLALRQEQTVPVLNEMRAWLDKALPEVPPQSAVGKALHYVDGQWPKLVRYVEDGRIAIDNNAAERAIRPFVIGRNNWLFSDTRKGAEASARLYSLITTAKANGHEPYRYLRHVFKELPAATSVEDFEALLPFNLDAGSLD